MRLFPVYFLVSVPMSFLVYSCRKIFFLSPDAIQMNARLAVCVLTIQGYQRANFHQMCAHSEKNNTCILCMVPYYL